MIIDHIAALEALDHYGIRVVRAQYVDSAEDAIAFAARRDAADTRSVPIVMSVVGQEPSHAAVNARNEGSLNDVNAIRASYRFFDSAAVTAGERVIAKEDTGSGTHFTIAGRVDDCGRKHLAMQCGQPALEQLVPLAAVAAEVLASHVLEHGHRGSEKQRRMLEHLMLRVSTLFERPEIYALALPVLMHDNSYTVLDATIEATAPLHIKKRLEPHARDRKEYGFRPAGRQ